MFYSPLRYPGGKGKLASFMGLLIEETGHKGGTYIEPFAGGAGIALELLETNIVSEIVINDLDKGIYSFWKAILKETDRFIEKIEETPINIEEWENQRYICERYNSKYSFELGFATFYMNRTNRSGIINGGVIGGKEQVGDWKLDVRFNKKKLIERIENIARLKKQIHLYNKDAESFLIKFVPKYERNSFIYFDPPYFDKGKELYLNFLEYEDHVRIKNIIEQGVSCDWIITYDDSPEIAALYEDFCVRRYSINYSAANKRKAQELVIFKNESMIPKSDLLKQRKIKFDIK